MKTIGILLGSLAGAGAEKSLLTLAQALAQRGNRVHLVLLKGIFDFTPSKDIEITVLEQENQAGQLRRFTGSIAFDLFVCSRLEFYTDVRCPNIWGFVCITPTAWADTPWWNIYKRHKDKKKLRKYHGKNLIAVSRGIASDLIDNIGVDPNQVRVIYNAYDFDEIYRLSKQPAGLPQQDYIVCVGALKKRKGQEMLLRAFARISNKEIGLLLIGKGEDEARLKKLAHTLDIATRVVFVGWVSNPYPYIAHAKLCVLASTAEGLPRVVVESLLLGVPVVATNCCSGPDELLIGELAKYLVPTNNYKTMVKAINTALDHYPEIPSGLTRRFDSAASAECYESLRGCE